MGEYTANETYKRSGKEIRRGIKKGPELNASGVAGFDRNGRPMMQKTGQKGGSKQKTDETTTINPDTPPTPPGGGGAGGTPPTDRAANPARKARERKPKETGYVQDELPAPPTTRKKASTQTPPTQAEPSSPGFGGGPTFDGEGNNTQSPAGKAAAAKKARTPKTPKAGA
jgi:hypothetical protein